MVCINSIYHYNPVALLHQTSSPLLFWLLHQHLPNVLPQQTNFLAINTPWSICGTPVRLGHPNTIVLNKVLTHLQVAPASPSSLPFCDACQYGKLHQISFPSVSQKTTQPFQLVNLDVWGSAPHLSVEGYRYYISFVDDFTRHVWIFPLRQKSESTALLLHFNLGIAFRHPCPYTHQQQGKAERKHCSIVEIGLTLLAQAAIDLKIWWEAFLSAVYLLNHLPTPVLKDPSPFECLFGYKLDYHFLKVFGCSCFPYLRPYNKHRLAFKTSKCVFLGDSPFHKGYKCLHPSGRIYIARSVTFDEHSFPYQQLFVSQSPTAPSQNIRSHGAPSFCYTCCTCLLSFKISSSF